MKVQPDTDLREPGDAVDDTELTDDALKDVAGGLDIIWIPGAEEHRWESRIGDR